MDKSIFIYKNCVPDNKDLIDKLGNTFHLWSEIKNYVHLKYPDSLDEWNFPGEKYGWSYRIKDKKRVIIYFLPRNGFFMVAFVFGQKAFDKIMKSGISEKIKSELESARVYAEGRGIRIDVNDEMIFNDIKELIDIKLAK